MRVIICGGRDFADEALFADVMASIGFTPSEIVSGASGRTPKDYNRFANGADGMGERYGKQRGIPVTRFYADFRNGKKAGPIRNARMAQYLRDGGGGTVIAFPGGRGTASMIAEARRCGLHVIDVRAGLSPSEQVSMELILRPGA